MEILIILFLILLNGFFAMSEIAMVSSRKSRLETEAKKGDKAAKKALELSDNPGKFLSTVQIGITLIGILTGIYSGEKIEDDLVYALNYIEPIKPYSETLAVTIIVIILTFFSLVLGELIPKRIGLTMPEKISKTLAFPMYWISRVAAPFIWLLTITSDFIIKIFKIKASSEHKITEEEIKALIQEGTEGGVVQQIEQDILERVFNLGDRKIASLMTPRNDTVVIKSDSDVHRIRETVNKEMHSVYPLTDHKNDIIGIIQLKDLFRYLNVPDFKIVDYIQQPQYISENLSAYEALKLFKKEKKHQAIVIDEYLLEALVGDVSEFYESEFTFIQRADGSWLIDGQFPLSEFLRKFDLDELIEDYPFNTLSGLILHRLKKLPKPGDTIRWLSFEIEILDMDVARIDKVLVTLKEPL
jgi:putative hemolysin